MRVKHWLKVGSLAAGAIVVLHVIAFALVMVIPAGTRDGILSINDQDEGVPFSSIVEAAQDGQVSRIEERDHDLTVWLIKSDEPLRSYFGPRSDLGTVLAAYDVPLGEAAGSVQIVHLKAHRSLDMTIWKWMPILIVLVGVAGFALRDVSLHRAQRFVGLALVAAIATMALTWTGGFLVSGLKGPKG